MPSSQHHIARHVRQFNNCYQISLGVGVLFSITLFLLLLKKAMPSSQHHRARHVCQFHNCYQISLSVGVIFTISFFCYSWCDESPRSIYFFLSAQRIKESNFISATKKTRTWQTPRILVVKNNVIFWIVSRIMKEIIQRWLNSQKRNIIAVRFHCSIVDECHKIIWTCQWLNSHETAKVIMYNFRMHVFSWSNIFCQIYPYVSCLKFKIHINSFMFLPVR